MIVSLSFLYFVYFLGFVASIALPYAVAYFSEGSAFEWRKIIGQLLASLAVLIATLGSADFASLLQSMAGQLNPITLIFAVVSLAWGVSAMGRSGQKTVDAVRRRSPQ